MLLHRHGTYLACALGLGLLGIFLSIYYTADLKNDTATLESKVKHAKMELFDKADAKARMGVDNFYALQDASEVTARLTNTSEYLGIETTAGLRGAFQRAASSPLDRAAKDAIIRDGRRLMECYQEQLKVRLNDYLAADPDVSFVGEVTLTYRRKAQLEEEIDRSDPLKAERISRIGETSYRKSEQIRISRTPFLYDRPYQKWDGFAQTIYREVYDPQTQSSSILLEDFRSSAQFYAIQYDQEDTIHFSIIERRVANLDESDSTVRDDILLYSADLRFLPDHADGRVLSGKIMDPALGIVVGDLEIRESKEPALAE